MMKRILLLFYPLLLLGFMASCQESDDKVEEYPNWQYTNEQAFLKVYNEAKASIAAGERDWKLYKGCLRPDVSEKEFLPTDYVVVRVLEEGTGSGCPLYTDTVRVAYRGHYIPTASYPEGLVFDQTYLDDFNWKTAGTAKFQTGALVDGFATALMHMHVGDRWRVRIPYMLGYGKNDYKASSSTTIPGYTNLVFEIAMYDMWHPGEYRSIFK